MGTRGPEGIGGASRMRQASTRRAICDKNNNQDKRRKQHAASNLGIHYTETRRGHERSFKMSRAREVFHLRGPLAPPQSIWLEKRRGKAIILFDEVERRGVRKRTIPPSQLEYTTRISYIFHTIIRNNMYFVVDIRVFNFSRSSGTMIAGE